MRQFREPRHRPLDDREVFGSFQEGAYRDVCANGSACH